MTACCLCPIYHPSGQPRLPHFDPVCDSCRARARAELSDITVAYALLPTALIPVSRPGEKVSGSRLPPVPLNIDAASLMGPGATHLTGSSSIEDQVGELPTAVLLDQWVADWIDIRDMREHRPAPTVSTLVGWLLARLDWALDEHPAIDEFCEEINHALRVLRAVARANSYRGEKAGKCPAELRDETRCNTQLYVDPYLDRITCSRCGSAWPRVKWLALRAAQDEAEEDRRVA